MRVDIDTREIRALERDLERASTRAFPYAIRDALNSQAFAVRKQWQGEIEKAFTLRNAYTVRSIRVDKASGISLATMQSVVGSVAPYMGDQEDGATVRGRGKHKAIPAPGAAGLPAGGPRTKIVRSRFYHQAINVQRPNATRGTQKQRNIAVLSKARRKGEKFALLERDGGGKGLYRVMGSKRKLKSRLLWDLSKGSVKVQGSHTLGNALSATQGKTAGVYIDALRGQLKRHKVLGH